MSSNLAALRYGDYYGALVQKTEGENLGDLSKDAILQLLKEAGFILFRGFEQGMEGFSQFVQRLSSRVTLDPARQFKGKVAQKVDAGFDAVGLHCENGNSPFMPHLCWFYCEKAASAGSQTTVCDGVVVWDRLSDATRRAFLEQEIIYSRRVEADKWKNFVFHSLQGKKPVEEITLDDLISLTSGSPKARITPTDNGSIHYDFQVAAAHSTLFSEQIAFANSILGPSFNYEKPTITFERGNAIPGATMNEIESITAAVTENINWLNGDVLLIDNTRVMHGRRAIQDPDRTIFNALSYL